MAVGLSSSDIVFPNETDSQLSNSDNLSLKLSEVLGLGTISSSTSTSPCTFGSMVLYPEKYPLVFDNPSGLLRKEYGYDGGSTMGAYYSVQGRFLAFEASIAGGGLKVANTTDAVQATMRIAENLGIPSNLTSDVLSLNMSHVNSDPAGNKWWYNWTVVRLSSGLIGNRSISQFNMIGAVYDEDLGAIKYLDSWIFVRPEVNLIVTVDEALQAGRAASLKALGWEYEAPKYESIESIRLDPDTMRFGYEYLSFWGSQPPSGRWIYCVVSVVDCETGSILCTHVERPPIETEPYRILLDTWIPFLGVLAIGSALTLGLALLYPEAFALAFASMIVPLYIRMKGAKALQSFSRGKIFGFILARPGATFSEMKSEMSIGTGVLIYHLQVLEQLELIKSVKETKLRRFYVTGVKVKMDSVHHIGLTEAEVLDKIDESGPIANSEIAKALGFSRQRTHYNLKLLRQRGLVENIGPMWRRVSPDEMSSQVDQTKNEKRLTESG